MRMLRMKDKNIKTFKSKDDISPKTSPCSNPRRLRLPPGEACQRNADLSWASLVKEVGNNEFLRKFMGDLFFHLQKKREESSSKTKLSKVHRTNGGKPMNQVSSFICQWTVGSQRVSCTSITNTYVPKCLNQKNIKTEVVCKHLVSEAVHKQSFPKMFPQFHKDLFQKNLSAPIDPVSLIIFRLNKLIGTARRIDSWWFVLGLCATYVGVAQKSTSFCRKREPWISR